MAAAELGPDARARIRREFRAGRRFDHPHLVRTWDLFEGEAVWAFSMERLHGALRERLADGPLPAEHAVPLALELLAALDALHSDGVVHRDLKPENVLLGPPEADGAPGLAKLGDLGIARFGDLSEDTGARSLTGTPAYMPPEAFGEGRFDPRGDLYALGLVLLELLLGRHPLGRPEDGDWAQRHRSGLAHRPDAVPPPLWSVLRALLRPRPEDRPRTAREVAAALAAVVPARRPLPTLRGGAYVAAPPLVGREAELAAARTWLGARLGPVPSGRPPVLWIEGEAGLGKSRLLRTLAAEAGPDTLHGRGLRHVQRPLAALDAILLALFGRAAGAAAQGTEPSGVAPTAPPAAEGDTEPHAEEAQRARHRERVDALLAACARGPVRLIVEDLHWCDEASLELIEAFARALGAAPGPSALIVTARPGPTGSASARLYARLAEAGLVERLGLEPLSPAALRALVTAFLVDDPRAGALAARLEPLAPTPLLVLQTVHLLLARGALDGPEALALDAVPATVGQIVGERVARLSGLGKAMVAMAAVLGSEFALAELAEALGAAPVELLDHLDEAERAGVVRPRGGEHYRFAHDELRDALVAGLGPTGHALHRQAAEALLRLHAEPDAVAERLADHLEAAGDDAGAWTWGRRAADQALSAHAFRASAERWDRAFAAAARAGLRPDLDALRRRGDALLFAGRHDEAGPAYRAALAREADADEDSRVRLLGRLAELEYRASRLHHALEPLEALLPRLGGRPPRDEAETAVAFESLDRGLAGEPVTPVPEPERARAEVLCQTYRSLAEVAYYHRPERKAWYAAEAGRLALALGASGGAAQSLALVGFLAAQEGRLDRAQAAAQRALRVAEAAADPVAQMFAESMVAAVRLMAGAPRDALEPSARAWATAQRVAEPLRLMSVASVHALALAVVGEPDAADAVATTMRELGVRYGYVRVRELSHVCAAAAAQVGLRFQAVLEHAAPADAMEASGSRMIAFQLRSYAVLARAFLEPERADPALALELAEGFEAAGFESMVCNPDAHALLVAALAGAGRLDAELRTRLEAARARGRPAAERNRAKTPLFLGADGLLGLVLDRPGAGAQLSAGLEQARARGLVGDLAVLEAARRRVGR